MKRKYIVLLHVLVWVLLTVNDVLPRFTGNTYGSYHDLPKNAVLFARYALIGIGFNTIAAVCFYGTYLLVAPFLFLRKRYLEALLLTVLLLGVLVGWRYVVEFRVFKPMLGFDNYRGNPVSAGYYISNIFWYYYPTYFLYGLMFFFAESWIGTRNRQEALQREKLTTELAFLRSQINPHFLFNTINDIYALTYQKSDEAPAALLKLSELLRYMLREGADDFVPLQSEINYLNNLIELQLIGAKGNACIRFEIEGYVGSQTVASLLFVAFVENAFKHGVLHDPANPVSITLQTSTQQVSFMIKNKVHNSKKDKTSGIGLTNVKRRLELLYPGKHELVISAGEEFVVQLKLELS